MIDPEMDRGGLKDSENAPNSIFPKINQTVFWRLGTDMPRSMKSQGLYIYCCASQACFFAKIV